MSACDRFALREMTHRRGDVFADQIHIFYCKIVILNFEKNWLGLYNICVHNQSNLV